MRTILRSLILNPDSSWNLPPCLINICSSRNRISSGSSHRVPRFGESIRQKKQATPSKTVMIPSTVEWSMVSLGFIIDLDRVGH